MKAPSTPRHSLRQIAPPHQTTTTTTTTTTTPALRGGVRVRDGEGRFWCERGVAGAVVQRERCVSRASSVRERCLSREFLVREVWRGLCGAEREVRKQGV